MSSFTKKSSYFEVSTTGTFILLGITEKFIMGIHLFMNIYQSFIVHSVQLLVLVKINWKNIEVTRTRINRNKPT